jgi:hypothetical protein
LKEYGTLVSVFTSTPSTRNSTRLTKPPGSLAVALSCTVDPAGKLWPFVGLDKLTIGGVFMLPPPLHVTPLSVNEVGAPFVPLNVPLKPAVNVAPLAML